MLSLLERDAKMNTRVKKLSLLLTLPVVLLSVLVFSVHSLRASTTSCEVNPSNPPGIGYPTIQKALDDSQCIDIAIGPGVYKERLVITRTVHLRGAGYTSTILDGDSAGRVVDVISASVAISGITIQNGFVTDCNGENPDAGAGIRNTGILTLTNVWVQNNWVESCYTVLIGGAIFNSGRMLMMESAVLSNVAPSGGGIGNFGILSIVNSSISKNRAVTSFTGATGAGGLYNAVGATASISATRVVSNEAYGSSGGIYSSGAMTITASEIAENRSAGAGGGVVARGRLTLSTSRVVNNSASTMGGGVLLQSLDVQDDFFEIQANEILSNTGGGLDAATSGGDGVVVRIASNVLRGNQGSAVELDFMVGALSDVRFERNLVTGNLGDPAPTVRISGRRIDLFNNIVAYNQSSGVSVSRLEGVNRIMNNTIWRNQGSGVSFVGPLTGDLFIQNNIIGANRLIGVDAPSDGEKVADAMYNNNVWGNSLFDYSGLDNQTGLRGNLSVDPLMLAPDAGNWRLSACSPMIDAGRSEEAPIVDFFGNPRPFGAQWDIGAVEFQGEGACLKTWLSVIQTP